MSALRVKVEDYIATVTFDKPPRNMFDYDVYNEFKAVFTDLSERADVYVVILNSSGKLFSVGHDVAHLSKLNEDVIWKHYEIVGEGLGAVYTCQKPTIAAVKGVAVGAGLAAVAACDIIIAAEDASFSLPEIKVGFIGGTEFLKLLVPDKIARYYAYTGNLIPAYRLYQYGSVLELVPKENVDARAVAIAKELLAKSAPQALSYFKQSFNVINDERLLEKYYLEREYGKEFVKTKDFKESGQAFLEKRQPVFTGE
ncbi:MAG TPA: hypothetical protein GXZ96_03320 [Firmicutes bacterium]|nr:hypothetical protein [Bacillota bacterium]